MMMIILIIIIINIIIGIEINYQNHSVIKHYVKFRLNKFFYFGFKKKRQCFQLFSPSVKGFSERLCGHHT